MNLKSPYRFPYNFKRDYLRPHHYWYYLKYKWQRMRRGISTYDTFNLGYHILRILADGMEEMADYSISYSAKYASFEEWQATLRYYAAELRLVANDYWDDDGNVVVQDYEERRERTNQALSWLRENILDLWD